MLFLLKIMHVCYSQGLLNYGFGFLPVAIPYTPFEHYLQPPMQPNYHVKLYMYSFTLSA